MKRKKRAKSPASSGAKTCAKAKKRKARKKKAQKRKKRARGPAKDQAKKPKVCEDARSDRPSLEVFEALTAAEPEPVSSEPAAEAETEAEEKSEAELPAGARVLSPPKGAAAPAAELDSRGPEGTPRQGSSPGEDPAEEYSPREDAPEGIAPEELTPEEALAMLAENGINLPVEPSETPMLLCEVARYVARVDAENAASKKGCCRTVEHLRPSAVASAVATPAPPVHRPRPPGSVIMPSCRAIAFESACVGSEMRVAATTVARLYGMVTREGLDLELGRVCQTVNELVDEWDDTPLGQSIILLVNLMGASGFLDEIVAECPEAGEAYWIVYETLRGEVTSARNEFLARQRAMRRAKAIGFGPRNIVAAARSAAEAVRWRVEWGYGSAGAAKAG